MAVCVACASLLGAPASGAQGPEAEEDPGEVLSEEQLEQLLDTPTEQPSGAELSAEVFGPEQLAPYFAEGSLAVARAEFKRGRYKRARALLAAESPTPPVRFLRAYAALLGRDFAAAAEEFTALAPDYGPLKDHCLLRAAQAHESLRQWEAAEARFREVGPGSPLYAEARFSLARVLKRQRDITGALAALQELIDSRQARGPDAVRMKALLAICDLARSQGLYNIEHKALLEVWATSPLSREAQRAKQRLQGLALPLKWKVRRAEALVELHRNVAAMELLGGVLPHVDLPDELSCRARLAYGRALRKERQHRRAIQLLTPVAERCESPEYRPQALYVLGYSQSVVDPEAAITTYATLARDYPAHGYADDALFFEAWLLQRTGRLDEALAAYEETARRYPTGNFASEALFRAFWLHTRRAEPARALAALEAVETLPAAARTDEAIWRARYWKARMKEPGLSASPPDAVAMAGIQAVRTSSSEAVKPGRASPALTMTGMGGSGSGMVAPDEAALAGIVGWKGASGGSSRTGQGASAPARSVPTNVMGSAGSVPTNVTAHAGSVPMNVTGPIGFVPTSVMAHAASVPTSVTGPAGLGQTNVSAPAGVGPASVTAPAGVGPTSITARTGLVPTSVTGAGAGMPATTAAPGPIHLGGDASAPVSPSGLNPPSATVPTADTSALDDYELLATERPATWYGLLARSRLAVLAPERLARVRPPPEPSTQDAPPAEVWPLPPGRLREDARFAAGVELLRLGLPGAVEELLAVDARGLSEAPARLLYQTVLRTGRQRAARQVARTSLRQEVHGPLNAASRPVWEATWPLAYRKVIQRYARVSRVDPDLMQGLIREESRFRPEARSATGALGLAQLMPSTARQVASALKLAEVSESSLLQPAQNVRLGAAYLGQLLARFGGNKAFAVAAYNAGPGAVDRWRQALPEAELDEWVEHIAFDETREYVKHVLGSYGAYKLLYTGEPVLLHGARAGDTGGR
ncbi:transglycosylase SLT domain-containing protein [Myxococcus stipitatus]|uniref:transglycosylase SLT domain-containing protein n=1 Tax=Myxococcus stipitatus TaxID=83455 RepID=UPI001F237ED2|nr:transglycosylase SLT domain-containing protein [Myxococcus stipitatus]MCE9668695.1 transglycosylase SLT domain-containing protein [Myxococcus stipitatus]